MRTSAPDREGRSNAWLSVLITICLCSPVPAEEQEICHTGDSAVQLERSEELSSEERFERARLFAQEGEYDAAIREYRQLSSHHPDNADYVFGEAQVRFWSGQPDCALRLVSSARDLAPGYEDVWKLEYQLLKAMPEPERTRRLDTFRTSANARFPGAAWMRESSQSSTAAYRWEAGIGRESLDNGAADWQTVYAHMDRRTPDDTLLSLTLAEHRRFSLIDNEVAAGAAFRLTESWLVDGSLSVSPHAEFLPKVVVDVGARRHLAHDWIAGIDFRHRRYAEDTVSTRGLSVEHYFASFRAAYHIDNTRLKSASSFAHRGVLNYYSQSGSRYGLTIAAGDEIEILAPGQLLDMDISAVALSGRHPLNERLAIQWQVGTHRQGSIYRRNNVGLSIAGEF